MCVIRKIAAVGLLFTVFGAMPVAAQTIGEIAGVQRQKLLRDISGVVPAPAPAPAPASASEPVKGPQPSPKQSTPRTTASSFSVHAVLAHEGVWRAEITDGKSLMVVKAGAHVGKAMVEKVDSAGVHITMSGACKKGCVKERVVGVGGAF